MTTLTVFVGGVVVGALYEKTLNVWKNKAIRAANAAKEALKN